MVNIKNQYLAILFLLLLVGCSNSSIPSTITSEVSASSNTPIMQELTQVTKTPTQPQIQYAFTKDNQHPEKMLEDVINNSKSSLDIAIYSLTKRDIVDSIEAAKKRGILVRIITDKTEEKTKNQSQMLSELSSLGIPIKQNTHAGLMHLKVTIADKSIVTTGSFNYSTAASTTNDEVLVVIRDSKIATDWESEFQRMWDDNKGFSDYQ